MNNEEIESKMNSSLIHFNKEINALRTGRASTALVEDILVDSYGTKVPINQLGNISVPEARLITIQVWDNNLIKNVEKAILDSNIGITPQTEGAVMRLPLPNIDEERRKELTKLASKYAEENKISIRNIRRDFMDNLKKDLKDKKINEDESKKSTDEIQKITDKYIDEIDKKLKQKQEEIMKV